MDGWIDRKAGRQIERQEYIYNFIGNVLANCNQMRYLDIGIFTKICLENNYALYQSNISHFT
jgi:hypothetical protein